MTARPVHERLVARSWLLLLAGLPAIACVLSPSPDIPGAMSDGGLPVGSGGSVATGGAGPCLLMQGPAESWCAADDLWVRNTSCQGDTWSVSPCPHGCVEASDAGQAACQTTGLGGGGLGGQSAGDP